MRLPDGSIKSHDAPLPAYLDRRSKRTDSCPGRIYRSFISSREKRRPARTWRKRFMTASNSLALPACWVNCSSHSRKAEFRVFFCDRATMRACSINSSSALNVTFFIRAQCTRVSCSSQPPIFSGPLPSSQETLPQPPALPRCAGAGCTWRRGRCARPSRS
jgi:hypothetical protein